MNIHWASAKNILAVKEKQCFRFHLIDSFLNNMELTNLKTKAMRFGAWSNDVLRIDTVL
jgi:hypothetical protein